MSSKIRISRYKELFIDFVASKRVIFDRADGQYENCALKMKRIQWRMTESLCNAAGKY